MKKNIIITLAILLVVLISSAAGFAVATATGAGAPKEKPSDYKVGISYDKAMESDKPMIALFYVDWCGYCLKFMPKFKTLSLMYLARYNFVMLDVENPVNKELVEDVGLTGFPTVYIIDPKYDNRILLNNAFYQNMPKMKTELNRYLRIRGLLDKANKK